MFFKNKLNFFASACYFISYEFFGKILQGDIDKYGNKFNEYINQSLFKDNEVEDLNDVSDYECNIYGVDYNECQENNIDEYHDKYNEKKKLIENIIKNNVQDMKGFITEAKRFKAPKNPNEENQYRILSFPWCIAGKLLSIMKFLS